VKKKNKRTKCYGRNNRNRRWVRKDVCTLLLDAFDITLLGALDVAIVQMLFLVVLFCSCLCVYYAFSDKTLSVVT
jgi:hypothetical protein